MKKAFGLLLVAFCCSCAQKTPDVSYFFVVPKGTWGYFVLPRKKQAPPPNGPIFVPTSGVCEPLHEHMPGYRLTVSKWSDGSNLPYRDEQANGVEPPAASGTMLWGVQTLHPEGSLWFVGTQKQFEDTNADRKLGLKKL